jgi:hypothetical protein
VQGKWKFKFEEEERSFGEGRAEKIIQVGGMIDPRERQIQLTDVRETA